MKLCLVTLTVLIIILWALPAQAHPPPDFAEVVVDITIDDVRVLYEIKISDTLFCETIVPGSLPEQLPRLVTIDARRVWGLMEEYFHKMNPVSIDGVPVRPVVESIEKSLLPHLRIEISYATKGRPKQVSMSWKAFPKYDSGGYPLRAEMVAGFNALGKNREIVFTDKEPDYVWHANDSPYYREILSVPVGPGAVKLSLPLLSICLVGVWIALLVLRPVKVSVRGRWLATFAVLAAAVLLWDYGTIEVASPWRAVVEMPGESEAVAIFETLHKNIYRAFDYGTESDIYDTLALSIDGRLLEKTYNDVYQGLMQKVLGGAVSRIQAVRILKCRLHELSAEPDAGMQFRVWCRWRVHGSVRHWGHTHARTNEYEAIYTVAACDGMWKITKTDVLRQEQVSEPI